jgi:ribosome biogenesis GTPase A
MGEFNRGKSTFINALLGQEVLPAYVIPTTAIINEVKWGQTKRAILHLLAGKDGAAQKQLEIPVEQIEQYVVIQESKSGAYGDQEVIYQNPYEKVELFWPLDLCRDGVEIIDSPGLNEDVERQKITLEYLKTVDVVLYVVACDFALSRSEMQVLETIQAAGHEHAFFIFNRINLIKARERDLVLKRCIDMVAPFTKEGQKNIFFIDALGALEGRLEHNEERIKQSNIESVEGRLKMFLATERGRVKLLRPAIELKSSIREARRTLPEREQLLRIDLGTLQERYIKAQDDLARLQEEQRNIYALMTNACANARQQVFNAANTFYSNVANQVPGWTEGYKLQDPIKLQQVFSSRARERVVEEVITYLTDQVRQEFEEWKTETFEPLLTQLVNTLASQLDERTRRFANGLEQVRMDMAADAPVVISKEAARQDKISIGERILAAAGGLLVGDVATATIGATFGFNEMLKSIIPQLAITVVTVALVGWNPFILIPAMLFGGGIQAIFKTNAINQKIRDAVGKEYAAKLRESRAELANTVAGSVEQKLKEIQSAVGKGLGLELQNIRDQVSSIIKMKEQEQHKVNQTLQELKAIQDELHAIESELDNFISLVALTKPNL